MVTRHELAVFAYNCYRPSRENFIAIDGWEFHERLSSPLRGPGFDGSVFYRGSEFAPQEIVIAFRGTDGDMRIPAAFDWVTGNVPAAAGYDWGQVYDAIRLVADTMAEYPGVPIKFTGHSLGGGLASIMSILFGVEAFTFDTAPFELTARGLMAIPPPLAFLAPEVLVDSDLIEELFSYYELYQRRNGRSNQISDAFREYRDVHATEDRTAIDQMFLQRQQNVTGSYLGGEALEYLRLILPTIVAPNGPERVDIGPTTLGAVELHSMLLLTAMELAPDLAEASRRYPALAALLLDETLYGADKRSDQQSFLARMIGAHMDEGGIAGTGILDRFADDLLRLGSAGATNHEQLRSALASLVIEYYNFVDPQDTDAFIGNDTNAIVFDTSNLSGRGYERLLDGAVALADSRLAAQIRNAADAATEWRIHTGTGGLQTTGTAADEVQIGSWLSANHLRGGAGNDVLIDGLASGVLEGGTGNDILIGGHAGDTLDGGDDTDYLDGGDADDLLHGGGGSDLLYGGAGSDNYFFSLTDGADIIDDSDGQGAIYIEGVQLQVGARIGENTWRSSDGQLILTRQLGPLGSLVITNESGTLNITVRQWVSGRLGITLNEGDAYPQPGEANGDIAPPATPPTDWPPQPIGTSSSTVTSYLTFDNMVGGASNDRMFGLIGHDSLYGAEGNDIIDGGEGNDLLMGGAGRDLLFGGAESDFIVGDNQLIALGYAMGSDPGVVYESEVSAPIFLGLGWGIEPWEPYSLINVYLLHGVSGTYVAGDADVIDAGAGDDIIMSGDGDDVIGGGAGNDEIVAGAGDDNIEGGADNDVIISDGQFDSSNPSDQRNLGYSPITAQGRDVVLGGGGADIVVGGGNADRIYGEDEDDILFGDQYTGWLVNPTLHGDDLIDGGSGEDFVTGDGGNDTLYGGGDNDVMRGDADIAELEGQYHGNDVLNGDAGDDTMKGGGGADRLYGGVGNDVMYGDEDDAASAVLGIAYQGNDVLDGGADNDTIYGGGGADTLFGRTGDDVLFGDQIDLPAAAQGNDYIDGGEGIDEIFGGGGSDTLRGGADNDHIEGDSPESVTPFSSHGGDHIDAGDGEDVVLGWGGNDYILGGSGVDRLVGDASTAEMGAAYHGNDYIAGGIGNDIVWGMGGNDVIYGNEDDDQLDGDDGSDATLTGDDYIDGGSGNDRMWGRGGNDVLVGGLGNDIIAGNEGEDSLTGDEGTDQLNGGDGNDVLDGGAGEDQLNGGAGDDTYILHAGGGKDHISDLEGISRIVLDGTVSVDSLYLDLFEGSIYRNFIVRYSARDSVTMARLDVAVNSTVFEAGDGTTFTYQMQRDAEGDNDTMLGTAGFDLLVGEGGNDVLQGGAGNDSLFGGTGNDSLTGGAGNDLLAGGSGNDNYYFNRGDGRDLLREMLSFSGANDYNVLWFGPGIVLSDLNFAAVENDLIISIRGTSDAVVLDDFFNYRTPDRIDTLQFSNGSFQQIGGGTVTSNSGTNGDDLLYGDADASLTLLGLAGNDNLNGLDADETLDGGIGNDVLAGDVGNDTYLFRRGDGQDIIVEGSVADVFPRPDGGTDRIVFLDLNRADLTFQRSGGALIIRVPSTGDQITIHYFWDFSSDGIVEHLEFADGTRLHAREIYELGLLPAATNEADLVYLGPANDTFAGLDGNDTIRAGAGNDTVTGDAGEDYLYGGYGNDVLSGGAGRDIIWGETDNDHLIGGAGNDVLAGHAGDDVLEGGADNDLLVGGGGSDTYIFNQGFGQDVIEDIYETITADRIVFGAGITAAAVTFARSNYNLLLTIAGTSDSIVLSDWFRNESYQLHQFEFADGSSLPSMTSVYENFLTYVGSGTMYGNDDGEILRGGDGNDYQTGHGGNDVLEGGAGNDTLWGDEGQDQLFGGEGSDTLWGTGDLLDGGAGNDTLNGGGGSVYVFGRGYGQDTISTNPGEGHSDRITFTAGTTASDVVASRSGNDLRLTIAGTTDTLTILGWFNSATSRIDRIEFADGTRLPTGQQLTDSLLSQIPAVGTSVSGTAGNDTLTGTATLETLYGLEGDDTLSGQSGDQLVGGAGSDTYLYNRGAGQVSIYDYALADTQSGTAADRVVFGADITASDVTLRRSANDLLLTLNGGTDVLTVRNWFSGAAYQVQFVFADNSALPTAQQIYTNLLSQTGTGAGETLTGFEGADSIAGGAGNDRLYGGTGDDTLSGDADHDYLYGQAGDDVLSGGDGDDYLYGHAGNDTLYGGGGYDNLYGGDGNDTFDSGADGSDDYLSGENGSDIYLFGYGYGADTIDELSDSNDDRNVVRFGAGISASDIIVRREWQSLTLTIAGTNDVLELDQWFTHPERLNFTFEFEDGSVLPTGRELEQLALTLVGDHLGNTLTAYEGNGTISGLGGNDTLAGGEGSDVLYGGDGNDTLNGDAASMSGTINLESDGNDLLYGEAGNDVLFGGGGNDVLDGGAGEDSLAGGAGNDTYLFGLGSGRDSINDYDTYDANFYSYGFTTDRVVLGAGITLDRMLVTRVGNDLHIRVNDADRLTITGWFLDPARVPEQFQLADGTTLTSSQIEARIGAVLNNSAPTLALPLLDQSVTEDSIFSYQMPANTFADSDPGDTLTYTVTRVGGAALPEWLTFNAATRTFSGAPLNHNVGSYDIVVTATDALGVSVSDVVNITVTNTNDAPRFLVPLADSYVRAGNRVYRDIWSDIVRDDDNDVLTYAAELENGDPLPSWLTIDPATGTIQGVPSESELGTYQVRLHVTDPSGATVSDVFEIVVETGIISGTEGVDTLYGTDWNDQLFGLGSDDTLYGSWGSDVLDGGTGNDFMRGELGDDTYIVDSAQENIAESSNQGIDTVRSEVAWTLANHFENLVLTGTANNSGTGNQLANNITGNSGNNAINGGSGADTLAGGAGNDTYTVDNVGDVVIENADEGTDLVQSSVNFTLADYIENLTLTGSGSTSGTGNSLDNVLTGNGAANTLTGNAGNDRLNGGAGIDSMLGGQGNDTYVVSQTGDLVTEVADEGIDLVEAGVTYTLTDYVENLTLTGSSTGLTATGNALDNVLTGNSVANTLTGNGGNDTLNGAGGTDIMAGGAGNDTYYVDTANDQTNENANEGTDLVYSAVARTLASHLELLFLTGTGNIAGTGNTLSNLLRGHQGNNTLSGGGGLDILEGGLGGDTLSNASGGNSLFNGGAGTDTLTGTSANDLLIGGAGNDALTTGTGADIIAFNSGDGQDTVALSTTQDNTVSLGGAAYADLLFRKNGNDLILQVSAVDQITFTGYYTNVTNRSVDTLQIVIEGTSDYTPAAGDALRDNKIERFDFEGLVAAFDAARAANPSLTSWALTNALLAQHLGGSDTAAIGGDLSYRYARFGNLSDLSFTPALGILGAAGFGSTAQTLQTLSSLQDTTARLS